jgi:hypothetical protein
MKSKEIFFAILLLPWQALAMTILIDQKQNQFNVF